MTTEELQRKYLDLCHAMQSGVAMEMNHDPDPTSPKHLRVGVNVALSDHGALVELLIEKKIIGHDEYLAAIVRKMGEEVKMYEARIEKHVGSRGKITLR